MVREGIVHRTLWLLLPLCVGCQTLPQLLPDGMAMPWLQGASTVALGPCIYPANKANKDVNKLEAYVAQHPQELTARLRLAEDLIDEGNYNDARFHLELFISLAQDHGEPAWPYLVRAHGRLVDVAEATDESFDEQLNRGMGLYWLARMRATEPDPEGHFSMQSLWCRAAKELQEARKLDYDQARVHLYLGLALEHLGQHPRAAAELREADSMGLVSRLTPWERRTLLTALLEGGR